MHVFFFKFMITRVNDYNFRIEHWYSSGIMQMRNLNEIIVAQVVSGLVSFSQLYF